jgi:YggT family protein
VLQDLLCIALTIYWVILIVRIILSWVPSPPEPVRPLARGVRAATDPLLTPLRGLIPPVRIGPGAALDLSPLLLFFAVYILRGLLCR